MTYSNQIFEIGNAARKEIVQKLDSSGEIILYNNDGEMDWDELYECPCQIYIGKHYSVYYYYITKLYKEGDKYFASGTDSEEGSSYEFDLLELDTPVLAELADFINE